MYKMVEGVRTYHPVMKVWDLPKRLDPDLPLAPVEALVHEVAHWTVLFREVPLLSQGVKEKATSQMIGMMSDDLRDRNEIEASALTYLTMFRIYPKRRMWRWWCVDSMLTSIATHYEEDALELFNRAIRRKSFHQLADSLVEAMCEEEIIEPDLQLSGE